MLFRIQRGLGSKTWELGFASVVQGSVDQGHAALLAHSFIWEARRQQGIGIRSLPGASLMVGRQRGEGALGGFQAAECEQHG